MGTTVAISPVPVLRFVDSNGNALVGGKLFTYQSGTTTKTATYTDETGNTQNTNPIILNARGEATVWLPPTQAFRFVLAPATDTDPPQSPIWTIDGIQSSGGVAVGNMTDEMGSGGTPGFAANVDFTPGTTTTLTLSRNYGSASNLWVAFDGAEEGADGYSLNGTALTFTSPIPVGVNKVFVKGGTSLTIGTPSPGTVTDTSVASGSKLYNRIHDFVDVKDFLATGNGTTDDAASIQNAINFVSSNGGGIVYFPPGTYAIGTILTVPQSIILLGAGIASTIIPKVTLNNLVTMNGALYTALINLGFNNAGSLATHCIVINNSSQFARVEGCYITNFAAGAAIFGDAGANAWRVLDNTFIGNLYCVFSNDNGVNSIIANNHMQSGTGIWLQKQTTQPEGIRIVSNIILPSTITGQTNSGHGIVLASSCLEISILSCIIDQVKQYAVFLPAPSAGGLQQAVKVAECWLTGVSGVKIVSNACRDFHMHDTTVTGCTNVGFDAGSSGADQIFLRDNHFYSNTNFDYNLGGVVQSNFIGNRFNSSAMGFEDTACSIVWENNDFSAAPGSVSSLSKYRYNTGYVTSNSGSTTWPSGSTSLTVNHGLSITPPGQDISLTPIGNLGGAPYITSITSSQITWTLAVAPSANTAIGWKCNPPA